VICGVRPASRCRRRRDSGGGCCRRSPRCKRLGRRPRRWCRRWDSRLVERNDTTGIETGVIARAQGVFSSGTSRASMERRPLEGERRSGLMPEISAEIRARDTREPKIRCGRELWILRRIPVVSPTRPTGYGLASSGCSSGRNQASDHGLTRGSTTSAHEKKMCP